MLSVRMYTCTRVKVFLFPYELKDTRESACSKNQKIGKNNDFQPVVAQLKDSGDKRICHFLIMITAMLKLNRPKSTLVKHA